MDETDKGSLQALGLVFGLAAIFTLCTASWPDPPAELMSDAAGVGSALFIAYAVEMAWLTSRYDVGGVFDRRVGQFLGVGLCGLFGIVVALLLSSHLKAGHSNLLDSFGVAWVCISLGLLGLIVALQPLITHGSKRKERIAAAKKAEAD